MTETVSVAEIVILAAPVAPELALDSCYAREDLVGPSTTGVRMR